MIIDYFAAPAYRVASMLQKTGDVESGLAWHGGGDTIQKNPIQQLNNVPLCSLKNRPCFSLGPNDLMGLAQNVFVDGYPHFSGGLQIDS